MTDRYLYNENEHKETIKIKQHQIPINHGNDENADIKIVSLSGRRRTEQITDSRHIWLLLSHPLLGKKSHYEDNTLTERTPCHRPMSFLKSRTFTKVSPLKWRKTKWRLRTMCKKKPSDNRWRRSGCSLTLAVVAGLGQCLAVGQHGYFRHGHADHCALFTRLVLKQRGDTRASYRIRRF